MPYAAKMYLAPSGWNFLPRALSRFCHTRPCSRLHANALRFRLRMTMKPMSRSTRASVGMSAIAVMAIATLTGCSTSRDGEPSRENVESTSEAVTPKDCDGADSGVYGIDVFDGQG